MTTSLIDGDYFCYWIGFAAEKKGKPILGFRDVKNILDSIITKTLLNTGDDKALICMSGPTNFRTEVAVSHKYKGQRKATKPYFFYDIKNYLITEYTSLVSVDEEADDLLGKLQWKDFKSKVIVTGKQLLLYGS